MLIETELNCSTHYQTKMTQNTKKNREIQKHNREVGKNSIKNIKGMKHSTWI